MGAPTKLAKSSLANCTIFSTRLSMAALLTANGPTGSPPCAGPTMSLNSFRVFAGGTWLKVMYFDCVGTPAFAGDPAPFLGLSNGDCPDPLASADDSGV
eukprot:6741660-Lingulodinium_polyedra.AAC.1